MLSEGNADQRIYFCTPTTILSETLCSLIKKKTNENEWSKTRGGFYIIIGSKDRHRERREVYLLWQLQAVDEREPHKVWVLVCHPRDAPLSYSFHIVVVVVVFLTNTPCCVYIQFITKTPCCAYMQFITNTLCCVYINLLKWTQHISMLFFFFFVLFAMLCRWSTLLMVAITPYTGSQCFMYPGFF